MSLALSETPKTGFLAPWPIYGLALEAGKCENIPSHVGCEILTISFANLVNILLNLCNNSNQTLFSNALTFARPPVNVNA